MDYDYPQLIKERTIDLVEIEGQVLENVLINVVEPEYNVLYLKVSSGWYSACGEIGSEILGFKKLEEPPIEGATSQSSWVGPYKPFNIFIGKKINNTRHIGEAWNGHGFEISFENMADRTLIVQSIYTGTEPEGFDDCLRLGIGQYSYETGNI